MKEPLKSFILYLIESPNRSYPNHYLRLRTRPIRTRVTHFVIRIRNVTPISRREWLSRNFKEIPTSLFVPVTATVLDPRDASGSRWGCRLTSFLTVWRCRGGRAHPRCHSRPTSPPPPERQVDAAAAFPGGGEGDRRRPVSLPLVVGYEEWWQLCE